MVTDEVEEAVEAAVDVVEEANKGLEIREKFEKLLALVG